MTDVSSLWKNGKAYQEIAEKKHGHIVTSEDLIRPDLEKTAGTVNKTGICIGIKYTGASTTEKLARVREAIKATRGYYSCRCFPG